MRTTLVPVLLAAVATSGCIKDKDTPPWAPGAGAVIVFEHGPHVAQCEPVAVTRTQGAARLAAAGVPVKRSSCGLIEGVMHPSVCGAPTSEILLHEIPEEGLEKAEGVAFHSTATLDDWRVSSCPQYLHAIEVAQETTSCVDVRNRVISLQSNTNPDERLVLLDQAGHCADASYRQVLFGEDGEKTLCSNADSIAGPQKSCAVPARAALFDTILANLDQPDLGLGNGWSLRLMYPIP